MLWWMVLIGRGIDHRRGYHVFDGERTAELIGCVRAATRFQWENAMGDLAIGVVGLMVPLPRHLAMTIVVLSPSSTSETRPPTTGWWRTTPTHTTSASRCGPDILLPIVSVGRSMRGRGYNGDAVPKGQP